MVLIGIGVALIILGVVVATLRTLRRGRLSEPPEAGPGQHSDTLEPTGKGDQLSLKADIPGIALFALGALLILVGSIL